MSSRVPFTIASFDVGIKNLAFCIMQYDPSLPNGKRFPIQEWRNIDLTDPDGITEQCCCATLKTKKDINGNLAKCTKQAKLCINEQYYCGIHNPDKAKYKIKPQKNAYSIPLKTSCIALINRLDDFKEMWETDIDHIIIEKQYTKNYKMIAQSDLVFSYFILKHIMNPESTRIKEIGRAHV